jgi:hypothetical protein
MTAFDCRVVSVTGSFADYLRTCAACHSVNTASSYRTRAPIFTNSGPLPLDRQFASVDSWKPMILETCDGVSQTVMLLLQLCDPSVAEIDQSAGVLHEADDVEAELI